MFWPSYNLYCPLAVQFYPTVEHITKISCIIVYQSDLSRVCEYYINDVV